MLSCSLFGLYGLAMVLSCANLARLTRSSSRFWKGNTTQGSLANGLLVSPKSRHAHSMSMTHDTCKMQTRKNSSSCLSHFRVTLPSPRRLCKITCFHLSENLCPFSTTTVQFQVFPTPEHFELFEFKTLHCTSILHVASRGCPWGSACSCPKIWMLCKPIGCIWLHHTCLIWLPWSLETRPAISPPSLTSANSFLAVTLHHFVSEAHQKNQAIN